METIDVEGAASFTPLNYSIDQACRVSGLGRSKLYELISEGELETLKVGKRRLVPADALRSCLMKFRVRG